MHKEFIADLREIVMERLDPSDGVNYIEVQDVTKNNNNVLTGFVFKTDSDVAPIIYTNYFYDQYLDGKSLEEIADEMIDIYHDSIIQAPTNTSNLLDFDKIQDKLTVKAMNYESNKEMLSSIPHQVVKDIAIIATIEVSSDENGIGTVKINDDLFNKYGVSKEELFSQAWSNMKSMHPYECNDMIDVVAKSAGMPDEVKSLMEDHRGEMFVLQTDNKMFGAAYGFDSDTMNAVCEQLKSEQVYVLPSSVNEVIIVPSDKVDDPSHLTAIVSAVNAESVPPEEFLSDNAYFYDSLTSELSIVDNGQSMDMRM